MLENRETVHITMKHLDNEAMLLINSLLVKALTVLDSLFILNSVITIVREIAENAQKANAKRMLFRKLGKNIQDEAQYREVMAEYSDKMKELARHFQKEMDSGEYYITLSIDFADNGLILEISNNVSLMPDERERVRMRLEKGRATDQFMDVYGDIQDTTEGGGMGLVLAIFMLKNIGVGPENLKFASGDGITKVRVSIPGVLKPGIITSEIKRQILGDVNGIPTFPEVITELLALCDNPESTIEHIGETIARDPALSSDVVRLSNSAGFIAGKRIYNVVDAVKTIGLKNVRALLMVSSARNIIDSRYSKFEEIWEHCNRVSLYARAIAHDHHITGKLENLATAGLLHDLGMIVLLSTNQDLMQRIAGIVSDRRIINSTVLEEVSIGISHSALGGLIARRWNFPDYLIEAIQHHHSPLEASDEFQDIAFTVYLANMLAGVEERKYEYSFVEERVMERFGISTESDLESYHAKLTDLARAREE